MAYICVLETGNTNLTCKNIDFIAKSFNLKQGLLFNANTAKLAKKLPVIVDMYNKLKNKRSSLKCTPNVRQKSNVWRCIF